MSTFESRAQTRRLVGLARPGLARVVGRARRHSFATLHRFREKPFNLKKQSRAVHRVKKKGRAKPGGLTG
jgi:hypothetical protein